MAAYRAWDADVAREMIEDLSHLEGASLPILHALQEEFGYVDTAAVPLIAAALNVSRAEVHGAVTFYDDFRKAPPAGRVIKLCRAEACQSLGCEALVDHVRDRHGIAMDADEAGPVEVRSVYCLGNCALGPAALVDGELVGRLDEETLSALCEGTSADDLHRKRGVPA